MPIAFLQAAVLVLGQCYGGSCAAPAARGYVLSPAAPPPIVVSSPTFAPGACVSYEALSPAPRRFRLFSGRFGRSCR